MAPRQVLDVQPYKGLRSNRRMAIQRMNKEGVQR